MKTIKTIDIQAKEWFDKVNGNSYFSAEVTVNFGLKDERRITIPFQYGYGDHYLDVATNEMVKQGLLPERDKRERLTFYCETEKIILRYSKQENCKKRDLLKA